MAAVYSFVDVADIVLPTAAHLVAASIGSREVCISVFDNSAYNEPYCSGGLLEIIKMFTLCV